MPPFVYRSLKDFMRVSATAKTRQELLQRLIANAAKRKSQLHIDATGARLATSPETFGMNIGKQMMNKQANPLTNLLARLRPSAGRLFDAVFSIPGVPRLPAVARPVLSAAEEAAERKAGVPPQVLKDFLNTSRPMPAMRVPSAAEIQQKILEKAERAAGIPPQKIMNKQANPLTQMLSPALKNLRGKVVPELLQRLQILAGKGARGVKRYGQRLMGDDTLKPLYGRQDELRALEQQLRQQAGSRINTKPMVQKADLMHDLVEGLRARRRELRDVDPEQLFQSRIDAAQAGAKAHKALFPMSNRPLEGRAPFSAQQNRRFGHELARGRASGAEAVRRLNKEKELIADNMFGMPNLRAGESGFNPGQLDLADQSFREQLKALAGARAHNQQHTRIWQEELPNVFRSQHMANKAVQRELDAIESARAYTAGGAAGATLGGVGYNAYTNSGEPAMKQSMTMPQPTSRGTMKKVQLPEASLSKPDCDPEGVQMSAQDHNVSKEAGLGSILKALAKGVYKTPRSMKALTLGGTGGYVAGRQHGHQLGLEDGREDAAKTVIDLFQKKQAFLTGATIGAIGGLGTSKPGQRASAIGRGALIGGGTELGAVGGAGFGGLTGTALGALLGGLISRKPEGALAGAGLGGLSGAVLGAGGGGYAGHIGTKALLDSQQDKDVNPKKRKNEQDDDKDKETKKAACIVLDLMHKNNPLLKQSDDAAMYRQYQAEGTSMPYHEWYAQQQNENAPTPAAPAPTPSAPPQPAPAAPQPPQGGFFSRMGAKADAGMNSAGNTLTAPGRALGDAVGSAAAGTYYAGQDAFRSMRRGVRNIGRTINAYTPSFRSPIHFPNAQQNNMQQ